MTFSKVLIEPRYNGSVVSKIEAGQSAPNPTFGRSDGSDVTLAELWRDGPVVLAFLRHFG